MNLILCLLMMLTPGLDDLSSSPSPAVAGMDITFNIPAGSEGKELSLASPFGLWQRSIPLQGEASVKVRLPKTLPLLLASVTSKNSIDATYSIIEMVDRQGKLQPRGKFWQAYLQGGFPAPFPVKVDQAKALALAEQCYQEDSANLVNLELLWRLQAKEATDKNKRDSFLDQVDKVVTSQPGGRLAIAASTIHMMLGDPQGAGVINSAQAKEIGPVQQIFLSRWQDIVTTRSLVRRTEKFQGWMEEDPFNPMGSQIVQLLAATYSARQDFTNTARFGLLSLRVIPDDAMTLNGVALAMASGGFQLERGLMFSERAISILNSPAKLKRPPNMSQQQWNKELLNARAAAIETKAWLLAKLKRYPQAKQSFDLSESMHPTDELYLHYGTMLKEQGKLTEARRILNKGLKMNGPHREEIKIIIQNLGK
jgi:tetratricopeptide (TPR) repeat protein